MIAGVLKVDGRWGGRWQNVTPQKGSQHPGNFKNAIPALRIFIERP
jgi:hypothetical protein